MPPEVLNFSKQLTQGVLQNKTKIDDLIERFAPAFHVDQMSVIDRNILCLAIVEILFDNKTSFKVAINEAVELAITFGSYSSPQLVNGVLGSIVSRYGYSARKSQTGEL